MNLTQILQSAQAGDAAARAEILRAAYEDLRKLASHRMRAERQNHTLSATALVHEVSLKLLNDARLPVADDRLPFEVGRLAETPAVLPPGPASTYAVEASSLNLVDATCGRPSENKSPVFRESWHRNTLWA